MNSYIQINLKEMINEIGEDKTKEILSDFYSLDNEDVESFLRFKSIEFAKQGLAATHLIFTEYKSETVLIGYFTLANKTMSFYKRSLSNTLSKKVCKFAKYDSELKKYNLSTILIAQLGKNYANGYNELISGNELLKMACDKVLDIQLQVGGKIVYLECEDMPKLLRFYSRNGFVNFGKRELDPDESGLSGKYLIQMLKYL